MFGVYELLRDRHAEVRRLQIADFVAVDRERWVRARKHVRQTEERHKVLRVCVRRRARRRLNSYELAQQMKHVSVSPVSEFRGQRRGWRKQS